MKINRKLTPKQEATIVEVVKDIKEGKPFSVANAVERVYNVNGRNSAISIAGENLRKPDFREALLTALENRNILGPDGKIEKRLAEGLDAEDKFGVDYKTRLSYIQEINKIAGVYAPEKHESRKMTLSLNLSKEELDEKIKSLQAELDEV